MSRVAVRALLGLVAMVALAGCAEDKPPVQMGGYDQCVRRVLFKECLQALPAGPTQAKYNDWDEVVEACADSARSQSYLSDKDVIKPECRS